MEVKRRSFFKVRFNVLIATGHIHPLHICITERFATNVNIDASENSAVLCLSRNNNNDYADNTDSLSLPGSVFITAHVQDRGSENFPVLENDKLENQTDVFDVWCTDLFLEHYKIDRNESYFISAVEIFPIQKVIIGVRNERILSWTRKIKFGAGLLVSVCHGKCLLREKDVFLPHIPENYLQDSGLKPDFYFDMVVLECLPLRQGILTVNTEIIIVLITDKEPINLSHSVSDDSMATDVRENGQGPFVSDFACPVHPISAYKLTDGAINVQKAKSHFGKNGSSLTNFLQKSRQPTFSLQVSNLDRNLSWDELIENLDKDKQFDPFLIVGMPRFLMLRHGLFDGAIVKISSLDYNPPEKFELACQKEEEEIEDCGSDVDYCPVTHKKNCPIRIAQVKMMKGEFQSDTDIYMSPVLMFNLYPSPIVSSTQLCLFEKCTADITDSKNVTSVSSSWDTKLPFAKEVQISLVNSPSYDPLTQFTEALKNYFQVARGLSVGDVFAVKSQVDPGFHQGVLEDCDTRWPLVYFKVIRIEPDLPGYSTYIVNDKKTTLIQIGSVHSYIPSALKTYYSKGGNYLYWEDTTFAGLEKYSSRLESLILPHLSFSLEARDLLPCILLTGQSGVGKTTIVNCVTRKLGLHLVKVHCNTLLGDTPASTEARLRKLVESAVFYSPCILLLQQIHVLGKDKEGGVEDTRVSKSFNDLMTLLVPAEHPVVVIATTSSPQLISHDILQGFLHQLNLEVPTVRERTAMLGGLLINCCRSSDLDVSSVAQRTAGFVLGDFLALLSHVKKAAIKRICHQCRVWPTANQEEDIRSAGVRVQQTDLLDALDALQSTQSHAIEAPKIPDVRWEDIGGLAEVRQEILDTIQLPLQHPELLAAGLRRSGVLLYGPPGSGKTLLAKAVATECSLNFISVKGPELINKYVGQSEENVRDVFKKAQDASPCVIFFDELDSLAPNRGRSGDSGGVMDRVVSQMLAELDGLHKSLDVFVIGATNRPDLLDPALLRPGRFDKPLFLGVSSKKDDQLKILKALTRKFDLGDTVNLKDVAEKCPMTLTGADFYALCSDAMLNALKRKLLLLDQGETVDQKSISVEHGDFEEALANLRPSLSLEELKRYDDLKNSLTTRK